MIGWVSEANSNIILEAELGKLIGYSFINTTYKLFLQQSLAICGIRRGIYLSWSLERAACRAVDSSSLSISKGS